MASFFKRMAHVTLEPTNLLPVQFSRGCHLKYNDNLSMI
jgi:hypothetical protein